MMFQPSLNPRDYGQARILPSDYIWFPPDSRLLPNDIEKDDTLLKESDLSDIIISCFNRWAQFPIHGNKDVVVPEYGEEHLLDQCLIVSTLDLRRAIRKGFRSILEENDREMKKNKKSAIIERQRFAIECVSILEEQKRVWNETTSVSVDWDRGIRIVATSRCIGMSSAGHQGLGGTDSNVKHRFAYKIRVENISDDVKSTVQLLGRTWIIEENEAEGVEGNLNRTKESDRIVHVKAPTTGAVGHLPVIRPGEIFEYMSGCELSTETGSMRGCLHLAIVDPVTESAYVGDPIDAFQLPEEKHFEIPVESFNLIADEEY